MIAPILGPQAASCAVSKVRPEVDITGLKCENRINTGLFFDGTNNNMHSDETENENGHSNVARLYLAYRDAPAENYYSFYIPGVGTPFPEIDEDKGALAEMTGKGLGWGGDKRILYGLIQVFNAVHRSFGNAEKNIGIRSNYFSDAMTKVICKDGDLTPDQRKIQLESNWNINRSNFTTRLNAIRDQLAPLIGLIKHPKTLPKPVEIMIDVFGFSRGAAEARVFTNKLFEMCSGNELFGVPMQLRFLGLFDTVASVNVPNSVGGHGHYGWSQPEDLKIDSRVKNWRHFVSLLEARASFPLDSVRDDNGYPPNGAEIVYPGAHSDVGGGYKPEEQGRGMRRDGSAREKSNPFKFSQVPLNDMFVAAKASMVPWMTFESELGKARKLAKMFDLAPSLRVAMSNYFANCKIESGLPIEEKVRQHQLLYLTWRYQVRENFETLPGTERAPANAKRFSGKQDLIDGNRVLIEQIERLEGNNKIGRAIVNNLRTPTDLVAAAAFKTGNAMWDYFFVSASAKKILAEVKSRKEPLPSEIRSFFDEHLHDSYAGFKLIDLLGSMEPQGYFHHRVVYAGKKRILRAQADESLPANEPNQSSFG
ncbi:T6SS phospholipase effector Tle1-like catalytic domain-containing protein [Collimonas antrihumi]|uniref:T6SS phospholipase effector Tle1-like catalytic domain-containing protein n=1 Tax=Collimonas antrihumi TaxID=1940615 RepID=UPI001B8BBDC3|nr:DUF2235 domain-containing protein [Collimonas antrihumi]